MTGGLTAPSADSDGTACRALRVARSVGPGSRRDAKGGVRIDNPTHLVWSRAAVEAFAGGRPSLALLVDWITGAGARRDGSTLDPGGSDGGLSGGFGGELDARGDLELGERVREVCLDGAARDE